MRKLRKLLIFVSLALFLTACGNGTKPSGDTIKVGVNLELSGDVSVYGIPERKGLELAVDEINAAGGVLGKQLELIFYDNAYDNAKAVENAIKLATQDEVVAMLGPATSAPSAAAAAIALQYEVLLFTPSGTAESITLDGDKVNPYSFRASFIDSFQGVVMANFASNNLGNKKAAIMFNQSSEYSVGLKDSFTAKFVENGGEVVREISYVDKQKDFDSEITKLEAADFDVLVLADYANPSAMILGKIRELGHDYPVVGPDGFETGDFNELAGGEENVYNVYFVNHFSPLLDNQKVKDFVTAFESKHNEGVNTFGALAYDTVYMLKEAIEKADSTDPKAVRDALKSITGFEGVTGTISFDDFNNPIKAAVMIELRDGKQVAADIVNP